MALCTTVTWAVYAAFLSARRPLHLQYATVNRPLHGSFTAVRATLMATIDDYVSRIEGTCGAESDVIVVLKYEKKDEAIANILKKAKLKNTIAGIIFELSFQDTSFRLYSSGKAIFRSMKNKQELNQLLAALLF